MDRHWLRACLAGGALFGIHQFFFFNSLKHTSVANVSIIGALQPALVLLVAGRMFGERASLQAALWSLVALAGTAVVVAGSAGTPHWSPLGDALAVGNLVSFTAYFLASKRFRSRIGASEYLVGMTTVAGIVILVTSWLTRQDFTSPHGRDWPILFSLAVFPGTLGHFLTNWAHRHTPAFVMSMMLLAVPVLATAGAALFLGEPVGPAQIGGGIAVLFAVGVIVRSSRSEAAREELAASAASTAAP
jgi:drug/metabolite transporter (DMT)-like permease